MSKIFNAIKSKSIEFRKSKNDLSATAIFLISEIQKENKTKSKNGVEPELTDDVVFTVLKREIKKENGFISVIKDKENISGAVDNANKCIKFYNSFLPTETSDEEIIKELDSFVTEKNIKQMGSCMKHLKEKFGNNLNNVTASSVVRNYLKE